MLSSANLARDLDALKPGGRIVCVGSRGHIDIDPRAIMSKEANVCGCMLAHATPEEREEMAAHVCAGLSNGTLRPIVAAVLPLADAAEAHTRVLEQPGGAKGKLVLCVPPPTA
mmetsp:Transcript_7005/g.19080  ORF Transcript_7005/g.19080 Transcript_7005/m.19080 type:complete len:113 (-) Transcript_7005:273-611(-)